jgi:hypothetical protein
MGIIGKTALGISALAMTAGAMPVAAAPSFQETKASRYSEGHDYRRGRHHRRDKVSAGDILTGIGILAGIAIIADAASKNDRRNDAPPPPVYYPDDDYNAQDASRASNDIGQAVDICSQAAERDAGGDARVDEIRSASRDGNGWRVEGTLSGNGAAGFICGASNGAVDFLQLES